LKGENAGPRPAVPLGPSPDRLVGETPGVANGRYQILGQLGEGGFGIVYIAEQREPVKRQVALKIIKLGMDTRQVVARFEAERQVLAWMDHPNIAKVFDAGATDTGRPFFVMELVRGVKITDYCDQNSLPTKARLDLFLQVCRAIQHAHQKGIIHRDIKPSNILVTLNDGMPVPKVIDFGIAKAASGERLTDKTVFTAFEQFVGTPAYMSPEQTAMSVLDIDTRSDIYSLGVLLYELLTGRLPFDPTELAAGLDAMRRIICEKDPVRPSSMLSHLGGPDVITVARRRRVEPPRLIQLVRGDLDWIAMKCLEKDRTRRYDTASGLAADIQRHLANAPVLARPPSNLYLVQKLVQHHKQAFLAATCVALALIAGLIVSTILYYGEAHAKREATDRLRSSYLAQAQAGRWSTQPGRRFNGLELLRKAADIRPSLDLRNEAIACLALTDVRLLRDIETGLPGDGSAGIFRVSPADDLYVIAETSGTLRLRRVADDAPVAEFHGYGAPYGEVGFSPDGRYLLIACGAQLDRVEVLDLSNRTVALRLSEKEFRTLVFSPDSHRVLISYKSGNDHWPMREYDLESGSELRSFDHGSLPYYLRLNPSQPDLLLTSDHSDSVRLWDWKSGKVVRTFDHPEWVTGIAWHPNGKLFATGCADGMVRLWDATTRQEPLLFGSHENEVVWVDFISNGSVLVSRGWDGRIKLWDVAGRRELMRLRGFSIFPLSQNGRTLAIASGAGRFSFLEIHPGCGYSMLRSGESGKSVVNCDFSPTQNLLLSSDNQGLTLWDPVSCKELSHHYWDSGSRYAVFDSTGSKILVGTSKSLERWSLEKAPDPNQLQMVFQHSKALHRGGDKFGVSRDGKTIAISSDGAIHVYDAAGDLEKMQTPRANYRSAALSPNGQLVAAWSNMSDRFNTCTNLDVWQVGMTQMLKRLPAAYGIDAAFSPDSRWLAVGDATQFRLWDVRTWKPVYRMPREFSDFFGFVAFSADSSMLAVASSRFKVSLLASASGQELAAFEPPEELQITGISFSADGTHLAVLSSGGAIQLWDLRLIREQLAAMGLDWPMPAYAARPFADSR
jgi:serine/threonine protein kinase/WD40 repeat protein